MRKRIEEAVATMQEMMSGNRRCMMEQMERNGKGECFILKYLSDKSTAILPSEISDAMHASTARISAALNTLEKKGQIYREIDKTNRRNILVTITEAGRQRIYAEIRMTRDYLIRIFTEMGEQDTTELLRLLKRFFEISNQVFDKKPSYG